jgi:hypothetical protein
MEEKSKYVSELGDFISLVKSVLVENLAKKKSETTKKLQSSDVSHL